MGFRKELFYIQPNFKDITFHTFQEVDLYNELFFVFSGKIEWSKSRLKHNTNNA